LPGRHCSIARSRHSSVILINFNRSSGGQPGQQWHFQVRLTWHVTATGAALQGPPTVTRTEDEAMTVLEAQAVAGNPRSDD